MVIKLLNMIIIFDNIGGSGSNNNNNNENIKKK